MTYAQKLKRIEAIRLEVTRERTGFALMPQSMTAAAYAADLAEAQKRA
jgi:hypothetical protein